MPLVRSLDCIFIIDTGDTDSWTSHLRIVIPHELLGTYIAATYFPVYFWVLTELYQWFYPYVIGLPWYFTSDVPVFVPASCLWCRWYPLIQLISNFPQHQPLKRKLHSVDNTVLHNIPILWDDVLIAEDIYEPSVPHLQGKKFHHKFQNVDPIIVPNYPTGVLDRYTNVTLWYKLMHINGIGLLNKISWHIMFDMGTMIKCIKVKNIEHGIKQVNKIYLQPGFKITCIHSDGEF